MFSRKELEIEGRSYISEGFHIISADLRLGCPKWGQPPDRILLEFHASDSFVCLLVFEDGKLLLIFVEKLAFEL